MSAFLLRVADPATTTEATNNSNNGNIMIFFMSEVVIELTSEINNSNLNYITAGPQKKLYPAAIGVRQPSTVLRGDSIIDICAVGYIAFLHKGFAVAADLNPEIFRRMSIDTRRQLGLETGFDRTCHDLDFTD